MRPVCLHDAAVIAHENLRKPKIVAAALLATASFSTNSSWLNLIEGFFSKLARSVLRHIRVTSKQELKERLMRAVDYFNEDPVVHTWTYKIDKAADVPAG